MTEGAHFDFWQGKRVLITGGAGFLGSFVTEALRERGASQLFVPRSKKYDLRRADAVQQLLRETRPQIVVHLAAKVGGIGANRKHPARFFYDNLMMGVQLLHQSWRQGVEKLTAIGTACSYPERTTVPFREDTLWNGYPEETSAPYGLAKKMLLVQSAAYRKEYGFNSICLLPVNLYGPRDNFDRDTSHVIPSLIRRCTKASERDLKRIEAWGTGSPTREFLYVKDAAAGIVLATERYNESLPVNLGSGKEISIRDLAQQIASLTGYQGEIVWDASKPDGPPRRCLDTQRAAEEFGFRAETGLDEGLRATIDWYCARRGERRQKEAIT